MSTEFEVPALSIIYQAQLAGYSPPAVNSSAIAELICALKIGQDPWSPYRRTREIAHSVHA
jgi:hypothetical protein